MAVQPLSKKGSTSYSKTSNCVLNKASIIHLYSCLWLNVPVCKACISFSELTSCHSFSIWDFTSSPSAAVPPTEKHPHTRLVNRGAKTFGNSSICGLCVRYLQPDGVKLPSWCGMDVRSWAGAKRSRGGGRRGGPGAPWLWILHDGTQGFTLCCCGRN